MRIEKIKTERLNPAEYNPRKDLQATDEEYKAIEFSLKNYGYVTPIVWNERTGNIVGGHQRYKVLKEQGAKEIEVSVVDLDDKTEKELNLALNKVSGQWDNAKLEFLVAELEPAAMEMIGFSEMLERHKETIEDTFEIDLPIDPITKLGDIWRLGEHKIMCGDSTAESDVARLMSGLNADMVFTDPPYNIDYKELSNDRKIKNDKMPDNEFIELLKKSIPNVSTAYVCCSWQNNDLFKQAMTEIGMPPKAMVVWNKINPAQHLDKYFKQHEIIYYFGKFGGEKTIRGDVWELKRQRNELHPTMKPIELIAMALQDNPKARVVYDGFGGSGSTLIACEQLNRKCYMMELDPKYCDVIIRRWEKLTGKQAVKI